MDVDLGGSAAVPGGEQDAALAALVGDVLGGAHHVGNAAQAGKAAQTESPGAVRSG